MKTKSILSGIIILISITYRYSYADISHYDLKGVDDLLAEPYSYLSPIHGFTLLGTNTLENMRFYGNYGAEIPDKRTPKGKLIEKGYGCLKGNIGKILRQNQDCPHDSVSELIQRLFPSQDGLNFVPNQMQLDILSRFDPEILGEILGQLSLINDQKDEGALENNLTQIITTNLLQKDINEQRENLKDYTDEVKSSLIIQHIQDLEKALEAFGKPHTKKTDTEKDAAEFASLLVRAMRETLPGAGHSIYPPHLVEHILFAYFFKKGNEKQDFISLLKGMHHLNPHILKRPDVLESSAPLHHNFLSSKYKHEDFNPDSLDQASDQEILELMNQPEKLAFYATQDKFYKRTFPPVISYGSAKHSSLGNAKYPDCGETSLRNFLNIVLYNSKTGRFDANILDQLESQRKDLSIHENLKKYYRDHSDPAYASSQEARNAWSEDVASKHKHVIYLRPNDQTPMCEMNAGIDNMLAVLENLLFQGRHSNPLSSKQKSRNEKLDILFKILSRDGFQLSWRPKNPDHMNGEVPNTGTAIEISVGDEPKFIWNFSSKHFAFQEISTNQKNWRHTLGEKIATHLKHPGTLDSKQATSVLPWVLSERNWDKVMSELADELKSGPNYSLYYYALPLTSTDTKLFAFQRVLKSPMVQELRFFAEKLQAKLPQNDLRTLRFIHSALADAGMPYDGEQVHIVGKPDVIYSRVSENFLKEKFGEEAAQKIGKTWMREMHGHHVAIGNPLVDSKGDCLYFKFENAKNACLDLNPPKTRTKVEELLKEREAALNIIRKTSETSFKTELFPEAIEEKLKKVHEEHPILGCYLMSREEWVIIQGDFGFREGKFIRQILQIPQKAFWTSSGGFYHPYLFTGNGNLGTVGSANRACVLCSCAW